MDTPEAYIASLPKDRQAAFAELRKTIVKSLPKGFSEIMQSGMITYAVPLATYPAGYRNPKIPLPFISIVDRKGYISLHHLGLYGSKDLLEWFTKQYAAKVKTKLDMGKGCVRFKDPEAIPFKLVGELAKKLTPKEWIAAYEKAFKR